MSKVIVAMVSFNTKNHLEKCLKNLSRQQAVSGLEIWVLDNNSADGSAELVSQKFPKVKLIKSAENLGFAKGQNEILKKARGDYYLLLNPDTEFSPDAVEKIVTFMEQNPGCGIAGCKLTDPSLKLQSNGGDLPLGLALLSWLFNLESIGIKSNFHRNDREYYLNPREVGWVGGTFMMIKKEVLEKVGLLSPDYFMYVEDVDFCYRALNKGFKIMIDPGIEVRHISGASSKNPKFYQWKNEFSNLILFYRKNLGVFPSLVLKLLIYISVFLRMVVYALLGKGGPSLTYAKVLASI